MSISVILEVASKSMATALIEALRFASPLRQRNSDQGDLNIYHGLDAVL